VPPQEDAVVEIRFIEDTPVDPEAVVAAATDFSARRPELWSNIDPGAYAVHAVGDTWAEATEGSAVLGGIWARERYDWSTPGTIRAEVQASNVFKPGSSWELRVRPADAGGGSSVEWLSRRQMHGLKGQVLGLMLRLAGRRTLSGSLRRTLAIIEKAS
jgi:hypothetical protein